MPYPSKINLEAIVQAARAMIEAQGVNKLSVNKLAERLGVAPPSLYRYVEHKTDLLRAVNEDTVTGIFRAIGPLLHAPGAAHDRIIAIAQAYRAYAHANPITYGMVYTNTIAELRPDDMSQEEGILPFQALMAEITGEAESLPALRGLWALMHGFIMLELSQQFRRAGDLDEAFDKAVRAYLNGWS